MSKSAIYSCGAVGSHLDFPIVAAALKNLIAEREIEEYSEGFCEFVETCEAQLWEFIITEGVDNETW